MRAVEVLYYCIIVPMLTGVERHSQESNSNSKGIHNSSTVLAVILAAVTVQKMKKQGRYKVPYTKYHCTAAVVGVVVVVHIVLNISSRRSDTSLTTTTKVIVEAKQLLQCDLILLLVVVLV